MDATEDLALHLRLLAGDATAPEECVRRWFAALIKRLSASYSDIAAADEDLVQMAAEEALLNYIDQPERFDPQRSALDTYLFFSARGDLLNLWKQEKRWRDKTYSLERNEAVELSLVAGNNTEEEAILAVATAAALPLLLAAFPTQQDRELLLLMLAGERKTAAFVAILGLENEPEKEQRRIVYQTKDRISKRLSRIKEQSNG